MVRGIHLSRFFPEKCSQLVSWSPFSMIFLTSRPQLQFSLIPWVFCWDRGIHGPIIPILPGIGACPSLQWCQSISRRTHRKEQNQLARWVLAPRTQRTRLKSSRQPFFICQRTSIIIIITASLYLPNYIFGNQSVEVDSFVANTCGDIFIIISIFIFISRIYIFKSLYYLYINI